MIRQQLTHSGPVDISDLIAGARDGSADALGQLLEQCRDYLLLVARREPDNDTRAMIGPSDLVQETFLRAQKDFAAFRGESEPELLGWLRTMLLNYQLTVHRRYHKAQMLPVDEALLSGQAVMTSHSGRCAVDVSPSPSEVASRIEQTTILELALQEMPPDYRQVLRLRYWDQLTFAQIGPRMGRSEDAARKLWVRAVERLEKTLEIGDGPF